MSSAPPASPHQNNLPGVLWALAAVGIFTFTYVAAKLSGTGAAAMQVMWLRYVGGTLTTLALLTARGGLSGIGFASRPALHIGRAAAGAFGASSAVYAASNMPVASASAIGLLDGFFIVLLGLFALGERISVRQALAIVLSMLGALVVVASQGAFGGWDPAFALPAGIALVGALLVGIESILLKALARSERALIVLLSVNVLGALLLSIPAWFTWVALPWPWLIAFLGLGPLAIAAQYCNIRAFRVADASVVGPVRYTWVVYGALAGAVFFHEPLTPLVWTGIALVLAGGCWLALLRARPV